MEIILAVIAMAALFLMYRTMKDYLANPKSYGSLKKQETPEFDDPYSDSRDQNDQPFSREHAVLVGLLAKLARSDGRVCEFEERLVDEILDDIAQASENPAQTKDALLQHFRHEQTNATNADELAIEYVRLTKGEYKKRLKVVEVLLMLAYADGTLDESEREVILDVAAYFELSNDDFNRVYDQFEAESSAPHAVMSEERALQILELQKGNLNDTSLKEAYRRLVKTYHPDIIQGRGADQQTILKANEKLVQINEAYNFLKSKGNR